MPSTQAYGAAAPGSLPERFGRYRIIKQLGKGGMGAVYLAEDTQLRRQVAVKVPHFGKADDARLLERFYREARAAGTLQHPNLCAVYDVGEIDGVHYLTMAYIEGRTLADVLKSTSLPSQRDAAGVVRKLALALKEAHAKGVIHRDLKPANIMITRRSEPVIMDFGLARLTNPDEIRLTQTGMIMGTPAYMPPEQVQGDVQAMGPGCDIYSLGVILYELLTGRLPFSGNAATMLTHILMQEPDPPSRHRPDLDPRLESICLKALRKKPQDRFQSMEEMAAALTTYLRAAPQVHQPAKNTAERIFAEMAAEPGSKTLAAARDNGRIPTWLWIAGVAAATLVIVIVIFASRDRGPKATVKEDRKKPVEKPAVTKVKDPEVKPAPPIDVAPKAKLQPSLSTAKLLFSDDFDNPKSGYPPKGGPSFARGYKNGKYFLRRNTPGGMFTYGVWTVNDCACEAIGRVVGDTQSMWGIELNNHMRRRGVGIYLNGRGELRLHPTFTDGLGKFPPPHREDIRHSAIKTGEEFNTLLVIARGRLVEVYVNGLAVCEPLTADFDFLPGKLDLFAGTQSSGEGQFERIAVWSTDGLPAP